MLTELQIATRKRIVEKLQEARTILMDDVETAEWSPVFDLLSAAIDLTQGGELYLTPETYVHSPKYREASNCLTQNIYALITLAIGLNMADVKGIIREDPEC